MNDTPRGIRPHIVILGKCNVGKSTLINALCGQEIALVSTQAGTTTDPVYKSMELLPFGPVIFVDTAGIDDMSLLGQDRVKLTQRALRKADLAVLVIDEAEPLPVEAEMLEKLLQQGLPTMVVLNTTAEVLPTSEHSLGSTSWGSLFQRLFASHNSRKRDTKSATGDYVSVVNAKLGFGIRDLREQMAVRLTHSFDEMPLVRDLLTGTAPVILVTPIDSAAPKGRLILPQVQMLRDLLDGGFTALVCREFELEQALTQLAQKPQLVITDSQVFKQVAAILPADTPLTSFSILMARNKGDLAQLLAGANAIAQLKPGDRILIAEACTHHSQEDDIGRVKIPRLLTAHVGGELDFTWNAGPEFPADLAEFKLIVHCGACMINRKEMLARLSDAKAARIPIVNYGMLLAQMGGILERSIQPLYES